MSPRKGDMMGPRNCFKICSVAAVLLLAPEMAFAEDWWKDSFAIEGSSPCDNNDSRVTFTDKSVDMWEVGCTLDRVQKLRGLEAVIMDMTCSDDEQSVEKRRALLLKLDDNKILRYPEYQVLQRCSELEAKTSPKP